MKKLIFAAALILFWSFTLRAQGQTDEGHIRDAIDKNVDLFDEDEPMIFTLSFDVKEFLRRKHKEEYIPAVLSSYIDDTLRTENTVRLKARGEFRKSYCSLAPFWMNFKKADMKNRYLQDIKKIKVVTQCGAS